ncbi:unnamed protein product [Clonostachys rosea]|uniref:Uncharacterized protein n=1 Tax=Bionectria ochroleuca TaxID=29856 RepID=A0ABY6V179_BIOOC|nr:unnamed protein product [Clonostachys rosea]
MNAMQFPRALMRRTRVLQNKNADKQINQETRGLNRDGGRKKTPVCHGPGHRCRGHGNEEGKEEFGPGKRVASGLTGERGRDGGRAESEQASGSQNEMIVALAKSVVARWGDLAIHE